MLVWAWAQQPLGVFFVPRGVLKHPLRLEQEEESDPHFLERVANGLDAIREVAGIGSAIADVPPPLAVKDIGVRFGLFIAEPVCIDPKKVERKAFSLPPSGMAYMFLFEVPAPGGVADRNLCGPFTVGE